MGGLGGSTCWCDGLGWVGFGQKNVTHVHPSLKKVPQWVQEQILSMKGWRTKSSPSVLSPVETGDLLQWCTIILWKKAKQYFVTVVLQSDGRSVGIHQSPRNSLGRPLHAVNSCCYILALSVGRSRKSSGGLVMTYRLACGLAATVHVRSRNR